jgi:hypothetical protein
MQCYNSSYIINIQLQQAKAESYASLITAESISALLARR